MTDRLRELLSREPTPDELSAGWLGPDGDLIVSAIIEARIKSVLETLREAAKMICEHCRSDGDPFDDTGEWTHGAHWTHLRSREGADAMKPAKDAAREWGMQQFPDSTIVGWNDRDTESLAALLERRDIQVTIEQHNRALTKYLCLQSVTYCRWLKHEQSEQRAKLAALDAKKGAGDE